VGSGGAFTAGVGQYQGVLIDCAQQQGASQVTQGSTTATARIASRTVDRDA
jgi:hypothetical protein